MIPKIQVFMNRYIRIIVFQFFLSILILSIGLYFSSNFQNNENRLTSFNEKLGIYSVIVNLDPAMNKLYLVGHYKTDRKLPGIDSINLEITKLSNGKIRTISIKNHGGKSLGEIEAGRFGRIRTFGDFSIDVTDTYKLTITKIETNINIYDLEFMLHTNSKNIWKNVFTLMGFLSLAISIFLLLMYALVNILISIALKQK